jgi:uncharacterized membrane protein YhdT
VDDLLTDTRVHPIEVMPPLSSPALNDQQTTRRGIRMMAMSGVAWAGFSILFLIVWVLLAFWPARVAGRKGHSFIGFFIFSLFFFPAALIVAYVVRDRRVVVTR